MQCYIFVRGMLPSLFALLQYCNYIYDYINGDELKMIHFQPTFSPHRDIFLFFVIQCTYDNWVGCQKFLGSGDVNGY